MAVGGRNSHLANAPAASKSIGNYLLSKTVGEGTFGKVYLGLNQRTGELFALKQVPLSNETEAETLELEGEIRLMKDLDHEHIVRYLGTEKSDACLCIFLEYVPGGSIASMLAQFGVFGEPRTVGT